jgi:IclR family KDG regulon transcriptional repressor
VKTLQRFFQIIELLEQKEGLRLQQIADRLNLDKSTVFRFLSSAREYGYVTKDDDTSKYSLGYRFLSIASQISGTLDVRKIAHPHLVELERLTGETIHLTIFDGENVVYIDKVESQRPVRMYSRIGNVAPVHCTAVGKAILAFQEDEQVDRILSTEGLRPYTPNTITDREELKRELGRVRVSGFAVDRREHESEICCVAAPVWDGRGAVDAAISISAVSSRTDLPELLRYTPVLKEKCCLISRALGHRERTPCEEVAHNLHSGNIE